MNRYAPPKDQPVRHSVCKTMFISKYGDGYGLTYSVDINLNKNDEIHIGIINQFKQDEGKLWFPFYVMMYMIGAQNDKEIIDNILFNVTDENVWYYIVNKVRNAFYAPYVNCIHSNNKFCRN